MRRSLQADAVEIADAAARVVIAPATGAAILDYVLSGDGAAPWPVFRPTPADATTPFDAAMILMLPWANRIGGGGFTADSRFWPVAPNVAGFDLPLHGDGHQRAWTVLGRTRGSLTLGLDDAGPAPWRYDATCRYRLTRGSLGATLAMTNRAAIALPYGGGFHPWFRWTPGLSLCAPVQAVDRAGPDLLPTGRQPIAAVPEWDFRRGLVPPAGLLDNAFTGWSGRARLTWPGGLTLDILADRPLRTLHVYAPAGAREIVCVEPVSHTVDALNQVPAGQPGAPIWLAPGETLTLRCRFRPRRQSGSAG